MTAADLMRRRDVSFDLHEVDLHGASDRELEELSGLMGLSLSLQEMWDIRDHFSRRGRLPTDVELQSIAQAWSEHCCYKSSRVFLKEHVFNLEHPDILSRGDAGVMAFDEEHGYALRIESHNHPSAIEPYGGAATGIGGIIRDVICMGAQPVALVDPLFFGPLDLEGELPPGVKHPRYLMGGVVAGIRDYGNRIGIPTVCGGVFFDPSYTGNCLVNVGCVGIVKRKDLVRNAVGGANDLMILVGGRTGRDGIHGVTFASAELDETSEEESRGAVQLGDPIMKEPLIHACLEVNSKGLISGMKDLGGGGLSCVVGEMALNAGFGAEVDLGKVPLKEEGLAPWEIWVSESQERMMLAAPAENLEAIMEIFDLWDVEATVIGEVIEGKEVRLFFRGEEVFDMDLEFLTAGPEYCRSYASFGVAGERTESFPRIPENLEEVLLELLADPNTASKEWVIRQYDHEVRAGTVIKPLQGEIGFRGHGDAAVIKPVDGSYRGLAIALGINPWFVAQDPYRGGMGCIDEVCRNIVSVGGRPHALTDCLNFGNPEKPERLGEFRDAVRGIGEVCRALSLPIPSGNVSFYNETPKGSVLPTPTVMGVGIVDDVTRCVTADLKSSGNPLYIVGETLGEMGGSLLFRNYGGVGGEVPSVDVERLGGSIDSLLGCMSKRMIKSCHDCSEGGIGIALAEMCISGNLGASVDMGAIPGGGRGRKLFCESNTRWIVEVDPSMEDEWIHAMSARARRIGEVRGGSLEIEDGAGMIDIDVGLLRETWDSPLWRMLG